MIRYFTSHWIELLYLAESLALVVWFVRVVKRAGDLNTYLSANKLDGMLTTSNQNVVTMAWVQISKSGVMVMAAILCLWLEPPPPFMTQTLVLLTAWLVVGALMWLQAYLAERANDKLGEMKAVDVQATIGTTKLDENTADRAKDARTAHALNHRAVSIDEEPQNRRETDLREDRTHE